MGLKIQVWDDKEAKKQLSQRLRDARAHRVEFERRWQDNERTVYGNTGTEIYNSVNLGFDYFAGPDQGTNQKVSINYAFKNMRFIHAQLSANPPSVVPRPTSNDPDDRRKADAADRLIRYALREYKLQEVVDRASLNTIMYGTGFTKARWNPNLGEILEVNEETGDIVMDGDFEITVPNIWNLYFDPDAESWDTVRYVMERALIPFEEAVHRFPEYIDVLKKFRIKSGDANEAGPFSSKNENITTRSALRNTKYDVVELFEYWEKGLPTNGYLGRFCYCTPDGQVLGGISANPERYAPPSKKGQAPRPGIAQLPYQVFSDIDVPNRVWGKSFLEWETGLQDLLNKVDNISVDIMQAHGVARLIVPESAEISPDSITNTPWDIIKYSGNVPPSYMEPMPMPSILPQLQDRLKSGLDDMAGVNDSMFGQQKREQSGFSMQYATNQGNMVRRRLFNKYVLFVEEIYRTFLRVTCAHWDTPRTIAVLGKEKAFESFDVKGTDIDGGYDLVVEYGASLSLDPTSRREEIITLMPLFEKAGVEPRTILKMMKLNELSSMYDELELASDRQREIFEEMISTGVYIKPRELQDHKNMLSFAYNFVMTTDFKYLEDDLKLLIEKHIRDREQVAAQGVAAAGAAPAGGGQAEGQPPPLPGPGGPADTGAAEGASGAPNALFQ
jgi:hypothetical protein